MYMLLSPAKVNLFLAITGKRKDGYHNLVSLFHAINLFDIFEIKEAQSFSIKIFGKYFKDVPANEENLIYKVKHLFEKETHKKVNFAIKLYKNIPPFKGLGGGSSNAAVFLKFLNEYFGKPLNENNIEKILLKVGSDTLFFYKATCALVTGRGEKVIPLSSLKGNLYIYLPDIKISTKDAYKAINKYDNLPENKALNIYKSLKENFPKSHDKSLFFNTFEKVDLPSINYLRNISSNFSKVTLSGSGSSLFSIEEVEILKAEKLKVSLLDSKFRYNIS